jgi:GNAT superfamily N-acetyltransferase
MADTTPTFERLDDVNQRVVEDFIPMLGQLSSTFARKDPEEQYFDTMVNLSNAVETSDNTAIFVHRVDGTIVSTATANLAPTPYTIGWVDDVVTLETMRGRGLGTAAMLALHAWISENGANRVRLTSTPDKEQAGNLYEKLGYILGGQVWRAPLPPSNGPPPEGTGVSIRETVGENELVGRAWATDCSIPTGHKAWVDGLFATEDDVTTYDGLLSQAHAHIANRGASSANVITDTLTSPSLLLALAGRGYQQRATRLYTLDIPAVSR